MIVAARQGPEALPSDPSTFSILANEATKIVDDEEVPMWHPNWAERCLAHVPGDQVRAAYNVAEYLPQRRRLLQWWADWLDGQIEAQARRRKREFVAATEEADP